MALSLSILDQSSVVTGRGPDDAIRETLALARQADAWGYHRYWLAEHHNSAAHAGSAPEILISAIAATTRRIRVGSAGVMLPHYSALKVAEQFRVLEAIAPGRIDLGLGRAPGTDQAAAQALRRYYANAEEFPADVVELLRYFEPATPGQAVQAVPGAGVDIEAWILGSSLFGARLAAALGLPYAFASHFAPDALDQALALYHRDFKPSARLAQPHVMLALNVVTADTDAEAARLFTTQQQAFVNLRRGRPGLVPPPLESAAAINDYCTPAERHMIDSALACRAVGSPATVRAAMQAFVERHRPDELILTANIFDHAARVRSFELTLDAWTS